MLALLLTSQRHSRTQNPKSISPSFASVLWEQRRSCCEAREMHLWPSMRIRDSFKLGYLNKLEWNLHRMKSEKESPSYKKKLLDNEGDDGKVVGVVRTTDSNTPGIVVICRELLMILSCCYCCFCCGACVDHEVN